MSDIDQAVEAIIPRESNRSLLAGLLLGALTGAVAAALFAPRSGPATRELIRERGLVLKDRADEIMRSRRSPL